MGYFGGSYFNKDRNYGSRRWMIPEILPEIDSQTPLVPKISKM
jgi:hypothetical protein